MISFSFSRTLNSSVSPVVPFASGLPLMSVKLMFAPAPLVALMVLS